MSELERGLAGRLASQFPDTFLPADEQVYQRADPVREDDDEGPDKPVVTLVSLAGQDLNQHPYPERQPGQTDSTSEQAEHEPEPAERARENRAAPVMYDLGYRPRLVSQAHGFSPEPR